MRASNAVSTTYADNGVWWWFRTVDTTPPTVVSSVRLDPSPTNAESVRFRVTFSEVVTGVDTADFSLSTTGSLSGAAVTSVSGAGSVYTATVSTGTGWGTLRLDIPATATITDLAGNPLSGLPYTGGEAYTVPNVAPAFTSAPVTTATQGVLYTYAITTTDPDLPYGDVLTVTAPTLPAWLTLTDHGNGTATLSGTPGSADVGDHPVVLRVADSGGLFTEQPFTITVAAKPEYTVFLPLVARNTP